MTRRTAFCVSSVRSAGASTSGLPNNATIVVRTLTPDSNCSDVHDLTQDLEVNGTEIVPFMSGGHADVLLQHGRGTAVPLLRLELTPFDGEFG